MKNSTNQLFDSIEEILENAAATQGEAYADMLTMALHVSQLTRVMGIITAIGREAGIPAEQTEDLREAATILSFAIVKQHAKSVGFEGSWQPVLNQATLIMERIEAEERKTQG